jgi:hypothetical protein
VAFIHLLLGNIHLTVFIQERKLDLILGNKKKEWVI